MVLSFSLCLELYNLSAAELEPAKNIGCKQEANCTLKCGHMTFRTCNDLLYMDHWPNGCNVNMHGNYSKL